MAATEEPSRREQVVRLVRSQLLSWTDERTSDESIDPTWIQFPTDSIVERMAEAGYEGPIPTEALTLDPIGVMAVHGIGSQEQGQHLTQVTRAMYSYWSSFGAANDVSVRIERAQITTQPATTDIRIGNSPERRVLFAEAWWAEAFAAPPYQQMARWTLTALPTAFGAHIATGLVRRDALAMRTLYLAKMLVIGLPMLLLLQTFLLFATLVAILPFKWLREALSKIQRGLAESIGDAYVFSDRGVASEQIMTVLSDTYRWLKKQGCKKVVILAHSQGAALGSLFVGRLSPNQARPGLVTYGSGLRKLEVIRLFSWHPSYGGNQLGWVVSRLNAASVLGIVTFGFLSWLLSPWLLVGAAVSALAFFTTLVITVVVGWGIASGDENSSEGLGGEWAEPDRDFYGTSDPVPNGPSAEHWSKPVYNTGSALTSHSHYWDNATEFVPKVALMLAAAFVNPGSFVVPKVSFMLNLGDLRREMIGWRRAVLWVFLAALLACVAVYGSIYLQTRDSFTQTNENLAAIRDRGTSPQEAMEFFSVWVVTLPADEREDTLWLIERAFPDYQLGLEDVGALVAHITFPELSLDRAIAALAGWSLLLPTALFLLVRYVVFEDHRARAGRVISLLTQNEDWRPVAKWDASWYVYLLFGIDLMLVGGWLALAGRVLADHFGVELSGIVAIVLVVALSIMLGFLPRLAKPREAV